MTFADRFWQKVKQDGPLIRPDLGPCWLWTGATMRDMRGKVRMSNPRRLESAPRVAFFLTFGRWPENLACHHCDFPPCCRPTHLFDGTPKQNTADMIQKGRNKSNPLRGDDHPTRKLSALDIPRILRRRSNGEPLQSIADDYGVNYQTIGAVVHRRTWKHVKASQG